MTAKDELTTIGVYRTDKTEWVQLCKSEGIKSADKFRAVLKALGEAESQREEKQP